MPRVIKGRYYRNGMDRRRRKDEPFNPFAPNASQKARDRKEKTPRPTQRVRPPEPKQPVNDLVAKQRAAMEAIKQRRENSTPTPEPKKENIVKPKQTRSPEPKPVPKTAVKKPSNREARLADLRAKSAATAQFAKDAKDANLAVNENKTADEIVRTEVVEVKLEEPIEVKTENLKSKINDVSTNVFKTIKTQINKGERKTKRRRPADKRGGGRQPQSKKLDRRKYLEYKYAARELLDNDTINEEHRSNILGQIWAKGERSGGNDAIDFINQKEAETIIPENVAEEFRRMVKKYTTKR